jgi:hypothetical protein
MQICIRARGCGEKILNRLRQQDILRALCNREIGIGDQHGEQFHTILRAEGRAARAHSRLLFQAGLSGTNLRAKFRAKLGANGLLLRWFSDCHASA